MFFKIDVLFCDFCSRSILIFKVSTLTFNDTHREKLCFIQFSTRMAVWPLLTFFICLHNHLSSMHSITRIKEYNLKNVALFSKFYGKTWVGFCLSSRKHFSQRFHFKTNRKSIGSFKKWHQGFSKQPSVWEIGMRLCDNQ